MAAKKKSANKKAKPALAKKKAAAPKKKVAAPAKKAAEKTPWNRMKYENGGFGLFFSCDAFEGIGAMAIFEDEGAYGNGYGWESVVAPAFERAHPALAAKVHYDCEADTFCARTDTDSDLDALATVVRAVTASREALVKAIGARDPNRD